jgi:hypothetical protein
MLFAFLGQCATTVTGAHDVLVSMSVGPAVIRVPRCKRAAIPLAVIGLITTSLTICLSVVPSDDETNKPLAIVDVVDMTFLISPLG